MRDNPDCVLVLRPCRGDGLRASAHRQGSRRWYPCVAGGATASTASGRCACLCACAVAQAAPFPRETHRSGRAAVGWTAMRDQDSFRARLGTAGPDAAAAVVYGASARSPQPTLLHAGPRRQTRQNCRRRQCSARRPEARLHSHRARSSVQRRRCRCCGMPRAGAQSPPRGVGRRDGADAGAAHVSPRGDGGATAAPPLLPPCAAPPRHGACPCASAAECCMLPCCHAAAAGCLQELGCAAPWVSAMPRLAVPCAFLRPVVQQAAPSCS
jgi:hypothetical protein